MSKSALNLLRSNLFENLEGFNAVSCCSQVRFGQ